MIGVRVRLVLLNVVVIGVILAAMGLALRTELRGTLLAQVDRELRSDAAGVETSNSTHLGATPSAIHALAVGDRLGPGKEFAKMAVPGDGAIPIQGDAVYQNSKVQLNSRNENRQGPGMSESTDVVTLRSNPLLPSLIPVPPPHSHLAGRTNPLDPAGYLVAAQGTESKHDFRLNDRRYRSLSVPVRENGRVLAVVQSVRDMTAVDAEMHLLDVSLSTLLPLSLGVAAVAGAILVGGAMRPLRRLTDAARTLDPERRLQVSGADEFADLATAFNEAFDKTSAAYATQQRALRQLERFTGDAGHELRTPLGAIKGSVTYLLDANRVGRDAKKSLEIIDRAATRMNRLIDDLLLLARQDAGGETSAKEHVALRAAAGQALEMVARAGISVENEIPPDLTVLGDPSAIERVFLNLLANATTYARSQVTICARQLGNTIQVSVEDDGMGIAKEHLPRLGERFYRPDLARSRSHGGVGLGLAIARGVMEAHGGSLEIRSTRGSGTTALMKFPAGGFEP
jgi:two-component system, OmpR family, sensor kinase